MADIYDRFETMHTERHACFGGANTGDGFVSDYPSLIKESEFTKTYIVKGGSGTGKSTLIRRAAEAAEKLGANIFEIRCGSDPDSLDGAIITLGNKTLAFADGTAPHTLDSILPGSSGEIVNCGSCWNSTALKNSRERLEALSRIKSGFFAESARYTSACRDICKAALTRARTDWLLADKLEAYTDRLTKGSFHAGNQAIIRTTAISMKGACRLDAFDNVRKTVAVRQWCQTSSLFFESLANQLKRKHIQCSVSVSPLGNICEIMIPEKSTSFVPYREGGKYDSVVNMKRFTDKSGSANGRQKRRFGEKCALAMFDSALDSLTEARLCHFEIEDIYKSAMDFKALDKLTKKLCADVKAQLS